jgi:hypothetical protein
VYKKFQSTELVVSLVDDALQDELVSFFRLSTNDFSDFGALLGKMGMSICCGAEGIKEGVRSARDSCSPLIQGRPDASFIVLTLFWK